MLASITVWKYHFSFLDGGKAYTQTQSKRALFPPEAREPGTGTCGMLEQRQRQSTVATTTTATAQLTIGSNSTV